MGSTESFSVHCPVVSPIGVLMMTPNIGCCRGEAFACCFVLQAYWAVHRDGGRIPVHDLVPAACSV